MQAALCSSRVALAAAAAAPSPSASLNRRNSATGGGMRKIQLRKPRSYRSTAGAAVVVVRAASTSCGGAIDLSDMSKLPGDPSVTVHTNIAMGDKKMAFMKAASKAVATCLGKPESFVVVAVMDEQDLIWGGEDTPCAICSVCSLGGINKANNTALSGELTALMSEFKVTPDRMYTNFWDIGQRENCGYNGVTFAEGPKKPDPPPEPEPEPEPDLPPNMAAAKDEKKADEPASEKKEPEKAVEEEPEAEEAPKEEKKEKVSKIAVAKLKRLSDAKILQLWRKKCPELVELWPGDGDKTQWEGVTFDDDGEKGRVTHVELDDMDITGDLPMEIGGLDALEVLALDGNAITGVPATIGGLKNLEQLYLSNNNISSIPAEMGKLANLETLWLNDNELTSIPAELGDLMSLETLDLSNNQLTTLPAELAELDLLEQLDIYGNEFARLPTDLQEGGKLEGNGCNIGRVPIE